MKKKSFRPLKKWFPGIVRATTQDGKRVWIYREKAYDTLRAVAFYNKEMMKDA